VTNYEVDAIGVWSLAKILGVMGLLWGVIMTVVSLFVGVMGGGMMPGGGFAIWIVGGPIYGVVTGAITAIVYNAAAALIGGVELELA
jgi:hypothetical protein